MIKPGKVHKYVVLKIPKGMTRAHYQEAIKDANLQYRIKK